MSAGRDPFLADNDGVRVRVRVTPNASTAAILGLCETIEGAAVQVKVRAVPEGGAANLAVEKLIAAWLEVPKSSVTLRSGAKSRVKLLHVQGDSSTLVGRLRAELSKAGAISLIALYSAQRQSDTTNQRGNFEHVGCTYN